MPKLGHNRRVQSFEYGNPDAQIQQMIDDGASEWRVNDPYGPIDYDHYCIAGNLDRSQDGEALMVGHAISVAKKLRAKGVDCLLTVGDRMCPRGRYGTYGKFLGIEKCSTTGAGGTPVLTATELRLIRVHVNEVDTAAWVGTVAATTGLKAAATDIALSAFTAAQIGIGTILFFYGSDAVWAESRYVTAIDDGANTVKLNKPIYLTNGEHVHVAWTETLDDTRRVIYGIAKYGNGAHAKTGDLRSAVANEFEFWGDYWPGKVQGDNGEENRWAQDHTIEVLVQQQTGGGAIPDGGFTLTIGGGATGEMTSQSSAAQVKTAVEAAAAVGAGNASASIVYTRTLTTNVTETLFRISFVSSKRCTDMGTITSTLTGGNVSLAQVRRIVQGMTVSLRWNFHGNAAVAALIATNMTLANTALAFEIPATGSDADVAARLVNEDGFFSAQISKIRSEGGMEEPVGGPNKKFVKRGGHWYVFDWAGTSHRLLWDGVDPNFTEGNWNGWTALVTAVAVGGNAAVITLDDVPAELLPGMWLYFETGAFAGANYIKGAKVLSKAGSNVTLTWPFTTNPTLSTSVSCPGISRADRLEKLISWAFLMGCEVFDIHETGDARFLDTFTPDPVYKRFAYTSAQYDPGVDRTVTEASAAAVIKIGNVGDIHANDLVCLVNGTTGAVLGGRLVASVDEAAGTFTVKVCLDSGGSPNITVAVGDVILTQYIGLRYFTGRHMKFARGSYQGAGLYAGLVNLQEDPRLAAKIRSIGRALQPRAIARNRSRNAGRKRFRDLVIE